MEMLLFSLWVLASAVILGVALLVIGVFGVLAYTVWVAGMTTAEKKAEEREKR